MKKTIACFTAFLFFAAAYAQPPKLPTVEERLNKLNEVLQQEVKPNASQKMEIENIFKPFFAAADKLRKDNPPPAKLSTPPFPPPANVRAAMQKLEEDRDESVKKLLTEVQYKKYKTAVDKLRPPHPNGENKNELPPKNR